MRVQVLIKTDTWCPTPAQLSLNQARMLPAADRTPLWQPSPGWGWDPLVRSRGDKLASSSERLRAVFFGLRTARPC